MGKMQGRFVIRHESNVDAFARGKMTLQDGERSIEMLEAVRGDDYVETPGDRAILGPEIFMARVTNARLIDCRSRKIKARHATLRKSPRQNRYTFSKCAPPVQDCPGRCIQVGAFLLWQMREQGFHKVTGLVTTAVRVPLCFEVRVPPWARVNRSVVYILVHDQSGSPNTGAG